MSNSVLAPGLARLPLALSALLVVQPTAASDSVRRYGTPSPGSDNIAPTIWVNSVPRPGNRDFALRVERSLGGTWTFPFYSPAAGDLTFGGVRFMVDLPSGVYGGAFFLPGSGSGAGAGNVPLPLPNAAQLVGLPIFVQAFTLDDFAANSLGLGATTGLRIVPALAEQLLVARSLSGSPDPQTTIDLVRNQVIDFDVTQCGDGRAAVYVQNGGAALVVDSAAARLRAFDATPPSPAALASFALLTEGQATAVAPTPDGSRAYVLNNSSASVAPIAALDVRSGATFGQAWPGGAIRLANVADALAMVFSGDSTVGYVGARGGSGAPGSVTKVDVRPGSATFHQQVARLQFPGQQVTGLALAGDGAVLCVGLVGGSQGGELALLDLATFTVIDVDAGAAGVQNLGGESSLPRTPLPAVLGQVAADPRGEEVYCASRGAIVRVNVARSLPVFRRVVTITDNLGGSVLVGALVVADAGDRLYVATPTQVVEIDAASRLSPRGWRISGAVGLAYR